MKLYVCYGTFNTPRPGGHPCANAYHALTDAGWLVGHGAKRGVDGREMAKSDLIVVWGGNPVSTQVNVMTHIAKARKERGAKLVVVDPYRTGTAEVADMHLAPLPGTDGALACAVMNVLFEEGYADRAYLAMHGPLVPLLTVMLAVLAFNFIGDALRDLLDPRSRIEAGL